MEKKTAPTSHQLYDVWNAIIRRTTDKSSKDYHNYGARGIKMCKEWHDDYTTFYNWSISHGWKPGLTIDRVCYNRGYYPGNCRFVTRKSQANNRRTNTRYGVFGVQHTIAQWSKITGVPVTTIIMRIERGWSIEKAINTPAREYKKKGA